jgi:carbamoyl-phosphate synthase large subunit
MKYLTLPHIDLWFLSQIEDLIKEELRLSKIDNKKINIDDLARLKKKGFSDSLLSRHLKCNEDFIRELRIKNNILPIFKRVDACAAEFEATTAYMYSSYDDECEANPSDNKKILILGGGPNRIGQGIEFDYCCVHASLALRKEGFETIMVNCNPETVSTDFDISDRLYFEPLTFEDVMSIIDVEKPHGVIVQYGGQTPLKLANKLKQNKVNIIGTSPEAIDLAEDREKFKDLVEKLGLKQPNNSIATNVDEALNVANEIGYPLVVRPSYVLGGRAMEIVTTDDDLKRYMDEAVSVSNDSPVLLDRFLNDAIEVDIDVIADGKDVFIGAIMEHIEEAGIHSGDSGCSIPPYTLSDEIMTQLRKQVTKLALELNVVGLMNTQFAIKDNEIFLLEVNPRASRTAPFVSKAIGIQLAKMGALVMSGKSLKELNLFNEVNPTYFSVKEAVLPFAKFPEVDVLLGPEMKSTGEVMGIGHSFGEAYFKAQRAAGVILPKSGNVFLSVRDKDKPAVCEIAKDLQKIGFQLFATKGTQKYLDDNGIECNRINKVKEGQPHIVDMIKNGDVHLIINTTEGARSINDSFSIRKEANNYNVCLTTTISGAKAFCKAILFIDNFDATDIQSLHKTIDY